MTLPSTLSTLIAILVLSLHCFCNTAMGGAPFAPHQIAVTCKITVADHLSTTVIREIAINQADTSLETVIQLSLPDNAYIAAVQSFSEKSGTFAYGVVLPKAQALQAYNQQKQQGLTTGLVTVTQDSGIFEVRLNAAANDTSVFLIRYEELLTRRLGVVGQTVSMTQQSSVTGVQVDVDILENERIQNIVTTVDGKDGEIIPVTVRNGVSSLSYKKSYGERNTQFSFSFGYQYSVKQTPVTGLAHYGNEFFAHYLAPDELPTIPKSMVFVIDVSGSMSGEKLKQSKKALQHILRTFLRSNDSFSIISFSTDVHKWGNSLKSAGTDQVSDAIRYVKELSATGATNINGALLAALQMFDDSESSLVPIIFFMTDGLASSGVQNSETIRSNVKQANKHSVLLFCMAFGNDANMHLLREIAAENGGSARKIEEGGTSVSEFINVVNEVSAPLMRDISISYKRVGYATQMHFPVYFRGSEMLVVGRMQTPENIRKLEFTLSYTTSNTNRTVLSTSVQTEPSGKEGSIERLYANKKCRELYSRYLVEKDEEARTTWETLVDVSLKYGLVTQATSMVIVQTTFNLTTNQSEFGNLITESPEKLQSNKVIDIDVVYSNIQSSSVVSIPIPIVILVLLVAVLSFTRN